MLDSLSGTIAACLLLCVQAVSASDARAASASAPDAGRPYVTAAYLREPPPGQDVVAGFFELHNPTPERLTLVGAECTSAHSIELHTHSHEGGVMRMRRLPRVDVEPDSTLAFRSGGLHLMIFGLEPRPRAGDVVSIDLVFADGTRISAPFAVRSIFEEVQ